MKIKSFAAIVATCTFLCDWDAFGCSGGIFMKQIYLGGKHGSVIGNYALVDDQDYEWLNKYKWHARKGRHTLYAQRNIRIGDRQVCVGMHRVLLGIIYSESHGDHVDGNGLNNQRHNIRQATLSQNQINKAGVVGSSKYKGVHFSQKIGKYVAQIKLPHKKQHLGLFVSETEAAKAYNDAATKYFGEFARLNIIEL